MQSLRCDYRNTCKSIIVCSCVPYVEFVVFILYKIDNFMVNTFSAGCWQNSEILK